MDELLALQQELAKVQEGPSVFKLSEPNVIEVVQKLVELGLVEVLYTTNGKEYLTPKQLQNEVEDEILTHGGRVNITELPPILNVDLSHIEKVVDALLKKGRDGLQLVNGELITNYYLDSLAEEISASLQGVGRLTLGELAVQHNMTTDFVHNLIEERLGSLVDAKLSGGTIYTAAYVARHTARVRGAMSALTKPISLAQLIKTHGFNEAIFHEAVRELHSSGRIPGTLQAKTGFTPAVYLSLQASAVGDLYKQNGVVEYAALTRLGVTDPLKYLQTEHPGGIVLSSCYMANELVATAEGDLEEACSSAFACDLRSSFASALTDEDVDAIIIASKPISSALSTGRAVRLASSLLASGALVQECTPILEQFAKTRAAETQKQLQSSTGGAKAKGGGAAKAVADDDDESETARGKGKAKKAARREAQMSAALSGIVDDDDAYDDAASKKKKKGKTGKKAGAGAAAIGGSRSVGVATAREGGDDVADPDGLLEDLEAALRAAKPAIADLEQLPSALAMHLLPRLEEVLAAARRAQLESQAGTRRQAAQAAQESLERISTAVQMSLKAASSLELPPKESEALDRALLKTGCTEWWAAMLRREALHAGVDPARVDALVTESNSAARKELLAALPPNASAALQSLEAALGSKSGSADGFVQAVWSADAGVGEGCPRLDKKREKAQLAAAQSSMREQLAAEVQPAVCLHLAVLLLHLELNNLFFLSVPGKLLSALIEQLQPKLPETSFVVLCNFQQQVQYALANPGTAHDAELHDGQEAVRCLALSKGQSTVQADTSV